MHARIEKLYEKATFCLQNGELEKAGTFYSKILAIDPDHKESFTNLTFVISSLKPVKALRILLRLQKKTINHPSIQLKLGDLFQQLGYSKKTVQIFLSIKDGNQKNADIYFKLGIIHKQQGEHHAAKSYFEEAFSLDPAERKYFDSYFDQLYILGKADLLTEACTKLLRADTNKSEAYATLGDAYKRIYEPKEAVRFYKKALEYSPENELILYQLGSTLVIDNDFLEAALVFKKVLEINPQFSQAMSGYKYALQALMSENKKKK